MPRTTTPTCDAVARRSPKRAARMARRDQRKPRRRGRQLPLGRDARNRWKATWCAAKRNSGQSGFGDGRNR
jgi:hypothetical protein